MDGPGEKAVRAQECAQRVFTKEVGGAQKRAPLRRKTLLDGVEGKREGRKRGVHVYICIDKGMGRVCWLVWIGWPGTEM
jgi:hypothetical protein